MTEPASGADLSVLCRLRAEIATKVGGDRSFASAHQPVRIAGSVHCKKGVRRPVQIIRQSRREVDLVEFADMVHAMPPFPGEVHGERTPARVAVEDLLKLRVREDGKDGISRFEALSRIIGHFVRRARKGDIDLNAAWDHVSAFNRSNLVPPWPEYRARREFDPLVQIDRSNRGDSGAPERFRGEEAMNSDGSGGSMLNDDVLAALFTKRHGADWKYCARWGRWLGWTGSVWLPDEVGRPSRAAAFKRDARYACLDARRSARAGPRRRHRTCGDAGDQDLPG